MMRELLYYGWPNCQYSPTMEHYNSHLIMSRKVQVVLSKSLLEYSLVERRSIAERAPQWQIGSISSDWQQSQAIISYSLVEAGVIQQRQSSIAADKKYQQRLGQFRCCCISTTCCIQFSVSSSPLCCMHFQNELFVGSRLLYRFQRFYFTIAANEIQQNSLSIKSIRYVWFGQLINL